MPATPSLSATSQLTSNEPLGPSVGPVSFTELNWVFFDPLFPHDRVNNISIPLGRRCKDYRSLFVDALRNRFNFAAIPGTIDIWKPKSDLPLAAVETPGWTKSISDLTHAFAMIPPLFELEPALGATVNSQALIHFAIVAEGVYKKRPRFEEPDEPPEFARYKRIIATEGMSALMAAKSTNYIEVQAGRYRCIHDGLMASHSTVVTMAPPLEIFHPVFSQFIHDVNDAQLHPTAEVINGVLDIMHFSSVIQMDECPPFLEKLSNILGARVIEEWDIDVTGPDGMVVFNTNHGVCVPLLIVQRIWGLGGDGCDPSIQAGYSMRRAWILPNRAEIRNESCCPTFLLASAGPWLCVLGGVFTDKFIVQRLTDMIWIGHSSTHEASRIYRISQVMTALSKSLASLREFYQKIAVDISPTLDFTRHRHRFYPYPRFFLTEGGESVHFDYLAPLEGDARCATYLAKVRSEDSQVVVVKFVDRYGADAHRFLANHNHAPTLRYCGPLLAEDNTSGGDQSTCLESPTGTSRTPHMMMVVMDFVQGQHPEVPLSESTQEQLQQVLSMLHAGGYVFGDLRKPNVLIDRGGKVKLVDFDWSGRYDREIEDRMGPKDRQFPISRDIGTIGRTSSGFVYYPTGLSPNIEWASGVKALAAILPEHDREMLEIMCR